MNLTFKIYDVHNVKKTGKTYQNIQKVSEYQIPKTDSAYLFIKGARGIYWS